MFTRTTTAREFEAVEFKDSYNVSCSLQESSNGCEISVWLGVNDPDPLIMNSDAERLGLPYTGDVGWTKYHVPKEVLMKTRMHLTQEQVRQLLPYLTRFAETGEF